MEAGITAELKSPVPVKSIPSGKRFMWTQLVTRLLAIVSALCSICIVVTSDQTITVFGIQMQATYRYSTAFKFQVGANAVVCVFVLFSLIYYVVASNRTKSDSSLYFYLFLHDMVMTVLIMSGCAAATAVGYVGRYGQVKSGWFPICDKLEGYCHKMTIALAFSYLSFISLLFLTFTLAYKIHSPTTISS